METRWYLFPGQTLQNTRTQERGHALHVTQNSWKKITAHLDRNRLVQEAIEKEQAHKKKYKEISAIMTKTWENSVENIRKRKDEEREARLVKTEEVKMKRFLELREGQQILKQKYIEKAKKDLYISKGFPKVLTRALVSAEVVAERDDQIKLQNELKQRELEEEMQEAQKIKEAAEQEKVEKMKQERKAREKNIEYKKLYMQEMQQKEAFSKKVKQDRLAKELEDNLQAEAEYEKMKKYEFEADREKKALVKKDFMDFRERRAMEKKQAEMEDKETDLVISTYAKAKHRIQCLQKKTEKEMHEALLAKQGVVAKKAVSDAKEKAENEQRIYQAAKAEKEQEQLERDEAIEAHKQKLIRDRNEDRRKFLEREEKRKSEETEEKKWEMLNRFKASEVLEKYEQVKKEKAWQKTLQYREELLQTMEGEMRKEQERKDQLAFDEYVKAKTDEEDKKFFDYGEECLEYAKNRGRSTAPVERVIREYKKFNNLPMTVVKPCNDDIKPNRVPRKII